MIIKKISLMLAGLIVTASALAGGQLDTFKFTGQSTLVPGFEDVEVVPIRWDDRCTTVPYVLNSAALPNAGTALEVSIDELAALMEEAFDAWNRNPASFIRFELAEIRDTGNAQRGFDMINEITFSTPASFAALASSPSTSLQQDAFIPAGTDINGDGIADFFDPGELGIDHCFIDDDGRLKHPAGFYQAGTILENDVQFSSLLLWATEPTPGIADIGAVALHEFGHSHGLAHAFLNQISETERFGSTMFPFISIQIPEAEAAIRQLHEDDLAWSAFVYPRAKGADGPAAVGPGEIAFDQAYQVVRGEISNSDGLGIPGANVYAVNQAGNRIAVGAHAGQVRVVSPFGSPQIFLLNPQAGIISGNYSLPLPRGNYQIFLQSPDVAGATGANISTTSLIGGLYGLVGFDEEGLDSRQREGAFERQPGKARNIVVRPGTSAPPAVNGIINESIALQDFTAVTNAGTGAALTDGVTYAQRYPNATLLPLLDLGAEITTATFEVSALDAATAPRFRRAVVALGRVQEDGLVSIEREIVEQRDFVAQNGDLSPFYLSNANGVARAVQQKLRRDPTLDLFVLLEALDLAEVELLPNRTLPPLLAIEVGAPTGNSFISLNSGPLQPIGFNWATQLILSP